MKPTLPTTPVLHLLAGPNGSGKSTYAERVLIPSTHLPFVNADVMAAARWPDPAEAEANAREASELAAAERDRLLSNHESFVSETVFSHVSKVDLVTRATGLGYLVHLHVILVPLEATVARVGFRVRQGGHSVPEQRVRDRYERLWSLVAQARSIAERTTVYDNSTASKPFRPVAYYEFGSTVGEPDWPSWTPADLM